jgi:uncharacterized protein YdbL (DUF1318 family)
MALFKNMLLVAGTFLLGACVTINVYFPAAAAEKAADRIIEDVWGGDVEKPTGEKTSRAGEGQPVRAPLGYVLITWLAPDARAQQANLDISTPAIAKIQASMKARHGKLGPFYGSGAVGLTADGLVAVRDAKAIPLASRTTVNQLVADENRDRNALYGEIARANGHPEWEPEIRKTFARRWVDLAQSGWYYQAGGGWRAK